MKIPTLGEPKIASPITRTVSDTARVPLNLIIDPAAGTNGPNAGMQFELAGPRKMLYFDAGRTTAGIVTCGGLCPGLNNVIRSLFLELYHTYGVKRVLGFRNGYEGLDPAKGSEPIELSCERVATIHRAGGTILGTSRGPVDVGNAVDNLIRRGVDILFTIGGDGTQRGANEFYAVSRQRGHALSVVGIPKTIDNDVAFVSRSFGYLSACAVAADVLKGAHAEAHSVKNGIAIVKLMGRHAGFIAAGSTVASGDVNFTLIPEVPFQLDGPNGFLEALKQRIVRRGHALIVVAEGAGQDLLDAAGGGRDASGNVKLQDIGSFLRERIKSHFAAENVAVTIRYIDPSYTIRSVPADPADAVLCDLFGRNAVHAAMAGKTGLVIGTIHDQFVHVPIDVLTANKKQVALDGMNWRTVLASTGQPPVFGG